MIGGLFKPSPQASVYARTREQVQSRGVGVWTGREDIRPSPINANDPTRIKSIRIHIVHISNIPPYLMRARKHWRNDGDEERR